MRSRLHLILLLTGFTAFWSLSSACTAARQAEIPQWKYADVRAYDPVDSLLPESDFLAFYSRLAAGELQVRIDWLDQVLPANYDLYLAVDSQPGGRKDLPVKDRVEIEWDTLIVVPANGEIQALDVNLQARRPLAIRVYRDPVLDTVILNMDDRVLYGERPRAGRWDNPPAQARFQLVLFDPDSGTFLDRSPAFGFYDHPAGPVRILLAFSQVYPAYSPATAIRRWDGAHSGPEGGRHGLFNLLRAAYGDLSKVENGRGAPSAGRIPLVLLDLKSPTSLSALDFSSGLGTVRTLASTGSLVLPEFSPDYLLPGEPFSRVFARLVRERNRAISQDFGLAPSPFLFTASDNRLLSDGYRVVFKPIDSAETTQTSLAPVLIHKQYGQIVIPLASQPPLQATTNGPAIELRQALIETALRSHELRSGLAQLLLLGGELPSSSWGDPAAARATFRYLESRPWIAALKASDLLSLSPGASQEQAGSTAEKPAFVPGSPAGMHQLAEALLKAPQNELTEAAWQVLQSLYAPRFPTGGHLSDLRLSYSGLAWALLDAAAWADAPYSIASCALDPDQDGQAECVLASESAYGLFEIDTGALVFLFTIDGDTAHPVIHQLVGPSSQLIVGLSDPSTWISQEGRLFDPSIIPAAFAKAAAKMQAQISPENIVFTSPEGSLRFDYHLLSDGISLSMTGLPPGGEYSLSIPILFDPWMRFAPGWTKLFSQSLTGEEWNLQAEGQTVLTVRADAELSSASFLDSLQFAGFQEDPNHDYPEGHYLPFPTFLLTAVPGDSLQVEIRAH